MPGFLDRLTKGKGAQDGTGPNAELASTPAGIAAPVEPIEQNAATHAYPTYRLLIVLCLSMTVVSLCLAGAIVTMMPLRTVEPYFLHLYDAAEKAYVVEPLRGSSYRRADAVFEHIALRYVEMRHEVVPLPAWMAERWLSPHGFIKAHSLENIWKKFEADAKRQVEQIRQRPYTRKVNIERITRVDDATDTKWRYEIFFNTEDSLGEIEQSTTHIRRFKALIQLQQANYGERPDVTWARINPFGIFVTGYSIVEDRKST